MSSGTRFKAQGIVLRRVDYGEFDRIITFLTKDHGKVGAMVKGVRKPKSRLAGGIELFSESDLVFLEGRGELDHVISSRLICHYRHILSDYQRMLVGYRTIELIERTTEDTVGPEYYELLHQSFEGLDDTSIAHQIMEAWFYLQLLILQGRQPDLKRDAAGQSLKEHSRYRFEAESGLVPDETAGNFTAEHIKAWRLLSAKRPAELRAVRGLEGAIAETLPFLETLIV